MRIKKWRLIVFVLLIAGVFVVFFMKGPFGKKEEKAFRFVRPFNGSIQKFVTATATIQPQNRLEMKSPIGGRIDSILVEEGQAVKTGDVLAYMSSTERAALLDAAASQGAEAVQYWKDVYKPTPIIAPLDGEVIVKSVQPGQTVTPSDNVLVLSDHLIVEAQVDETDIGKVKKGQKAVVTLDAYPDIKVDATVGHIYYESKLVNNVTIYNVDILPSQVPDVFRSGMSANVNIIQESKDNILLVPLEAITRGKDKEGSFVRVSRGKNSKSEERRVELGIADENNAEIISGIDANDTLVIKTRKSSAVSKSSQPKTNPFLPGGSRRQA